MLSKVGKTGGVLAAAAMALAAAAAHADPCLDPHRPATGPNGLCAPVDTNTRVTPSSAPVRIALLLPLRSGKLAEAAESVRAGFMAGGERDGAGFQVDIVSTSDTTADALDAYARAASANDIVVGPMLKPAVAALAGVANPKPTVALNTAERADTPAPKWVLVAALSVEAEARDVAAWAAREHPHGRALVLTGGAAWAQRAAGAFEARWSELGHTSQRHVVTSNRRQEAIGDLKARLEIDPPDLLFAALDVAELRAVRAATGTAVPCYGGGSINPGRDNGAGIAELDGVRILDLPFLVRPDHPSVSVYPRPLNPEGVLDMDRLYALGIDAFLLARALALHPGAPAAFDGASGRLELVRDDNGNGDGALRLRRRETAVVYRDGRFDPVDDAH